MTTSQCYKIKVDEPKRCKPGQFVYANNESNIVIGFISHVEGSEAIFTIFHPIELPVNAINIAEKLSPAQVTELLKTSIEKNPEMEQEWINLVLTPEIVESP